MDIVGTLLKGMAEPSASFKTENKVAKIDNEDSLVKENLLFSLKKENPSKSIDDTVLNAGKVQKQSLYKCPVCGRVYTAQKQFNRHKHNHERNKNKRKKIVDMATRKTTKPFPNPATSEGLSLNLTYVPPTTTQRGVNMQSSPSKDVEHPSRHEQFWNFYQERKSADAVQVDHSSEESQSRAILPEMKPSYKCKICDRIFTVKKTYINHKTNHIHNRNTGKMLFFYRAKEE